MVDDVSGALEVGMRAVWRKNASAFPTAIAVPTAEIERLSELPELLQRWGGP
jgi:putative hydrolase of the HAD superfamily